MKEEKILKGNIIIVINAKIWIKFIEGIYNNAVKSSQDENFKKKMLSNYVELNPRNLK